MSEWTSISVTQAQKDQLQTHKPDNMAMGEFLVDRIENGRQGGQPDLTTLEAQLSETASLVEELTRRDSTDIDREGLAKKVAADTEHAAYRGAKDAIEEHL